MSEGVVFERVHRRKGSANGVGMQWFRSEGWQADSLELVLIYIMCAAELSPATSQGRTGIV